MHDMQLIKKTYITCNACASRGIYSYDMMMKCDTLIWKRHAWYAEWWW